MAWEIIFGILAGIGVIVAVAVLYLLASIPGHLHRIRNSDWKPGDRIPLE